MRQIIQRLGDFWSSCAQLRSQFTFLAIKYPLAVEAVVDDHEQEYLKATATVMLPSIKGKTFISFISDKDTYTRWPLSVHGLKVDVKVAYGNIQCVLIVLPLYLCPDHGQLHMCRSEVILQGLLESLSTVTPARNFGCFLDACVQATEQYA